MIKFNSTKRNAAGGSPQRFMDNAGHMSRAHAERLHKLTPAPDGSPEPGFLCNLSASDRALSDSLAEETVANMTSGQQEHPSQVAREDLAELSIDAPEDADIEIPEQPAPDTFDDDEPGSSQ